MNSESPAGDGAPKSGKEKKKEIKPILISNIPYFIIASLFLLFIFILYPEGVKNYGLIFIPMPFIFFAVLISVVLGITYALKYILKTDYDFSNAPILVRNWKRYFPNNWEAIKSNSIIVMFVFWVCLMLAGAFLEHKSTFVFIMTCGFLSFTLPPLTLYLLLKWKKLKYLAIGKYKIEAGPFAFSWALFLIILLKLLQVLKQQKIMGDPHRMIMGLIIVVIAYIALIVLTLLQKNEENIIEKQDENQV